MENGEEALLLLRRHWSPGPPRLLLSYQQLSDSQNEVSHVTRWWWSTAMFLSRCLCTWYLSILYRLIAISIEPHMVMSNVVYQYCRRSMLPISLPTTFWSDFYCHCCFFYLVITVKQAAIVVNDRSFLLTTVILVHGKWAVWRQATAYRHSCPKT